MLQIDDYFRNNSFLECVLIKYELDTKFNTFTLISDYINWDLPEGEREFRRLFFKEVRNYSRLTGKDNRAVLEPNYFSSEDTPETILFQNINLSGPNENYFKIVIEANYNFGSIEFEFMELEESKKIGIGRQISNYEWVYNDKVDNHEFSFNDPFK